MRDFQTFWIVWCENGGPPTIRHNTEQSARVEAERLARNVPGRRFVVLRTIAACEKIDVDWFYDDPIPF